jgi:hypothetical protein
MGWGCSAAGKRTIITPVGCAYTPVDKGIAECEAVVVDVNAVLRKKLVYPGAGPERVPMGVMRQFVKTLCDDTYAHAKTFVFCFDSPHLVPEERHVFYATKRYAPDKKTRALKKGETRAADGKIYKDCDLPAPDTDVYGITPTQVPAGSSGSLVWSRLWNNAKTKARLWEVLCVCLEFIVEERLKTSGLPQKFYIDAPNGQRKCFPATDATMSLTKQGWVQWGEADTKCFQYAVCLADTHTNVYIDTIDWDMFIQILPHAIPNVHINIASVLRAGGMSFYSEASVERAKKTQGLVLASKPVRHFEIVRGSTLASVFGTRRERLHAMFWCLCCGGVDYCDGLRAFGCTEAILLKLFQSGAYKHHKFIDEGMDTTTPTLRVVRFRPRAFVQLLCDLMAAETRKRKRDPDVAAFVEELYHILFCVLYYLGFDAHRERGGPIMDDIHRLSLCTSALPATLDPAAFVESICLRETYPVATETLAPYPAASNYLFCASQSCAINEARGSGGSTGFH